MPQPYKTMYYLINTTEGREAKREDYPNLGLPLVTMNASTSNLSGFIYVKETKADDLVSEEGQRIIHQPNVVKEVDGEWQIFTNIQGVVDIVDEVPAQVEVYKLAIVLNEMGIDVDAAIANLPAPPKKAAELAWGKASYAHRSHDLITMLQGVFSLTDEQADQIFITASKLYPDS